MGVQMMRDVKLYLQGKFGIEVKTVLKFLEIIWKVIP
jgi:hypothetical protein